MKIIIIIDIFSVLSGGCGEWMECDDINVTCLFVGNSLLVIGKKSLFLLTHLHAVKLLTHPTHVLAMFLCESEITRNDKGSQLRGFKGYTPEKEKKERKKDR